MGKKFMSKAELAPKPSKPAQTPAGKTSGSMSPQLALKMGKGKKKAK